MAIIPQTRLFSWEDVENLGELKRLRLVLEAPPDELFMRHLEPDRANGRADYPVRATWNSVLAGIVFQHPTMESLKRELLRNAQLCQVCGFDPLKGTEQELPAGYEVTPASRLPVRCTQTGPDNKVFPDLLDGVAERHPDLLTGAEALVGDKG